MSNATRVVPHSIASTTPVRLIPENDQVRASVKGAAPGVTGNRSWLAAESGCWVWNNLGRGSNTAVHCPAGRTTSQTEYFPLARGWPLILTSFPTSRVVARFAPGVHTSPHLTTRPNSESRVRARGREYSTVSLVPSTVWATRAGSLARTCAQTAGGAPSEIAIAANG